MTEPMFSRAWGDLVDRSEDALAVELPALASDSIVTLVTEEVTFRFRVIDPARLLVVVIDGDEDMPSGMTGYLQGSALTPHGSMRGGWIAVGYYAVFGSEEFPFLPAYVELGRTDVLYVNGTRIAHPDDRAAIN